LKIAVLGRGTIGAVLADAFGQHPDVEHIVTTTRSGGESNAQAAAGSDVIVLCVKPHQVHDVLAEIAPHLSETHTLVSVSASISTEQLRTWSGGRCRVVRVMPNMPARVLEGMSVVGRAGDADAIEVAHRLFGRLGRVTVLDESLFDAATAVSGCGPAYGYLITEALSDAGVRLGLPREQALLLAAQTLLGAAKMVLQSGIHPAALKDEVTTPAGCTIDALLILEDGKLRSTIMRAASAAATRAAEAAQKT
jgi:pyrroline-5-carboxylate reductase